MKHSHHKGISMIELLAIVVIVCVLMVIVFFSLDPVTRYQKVRTQTRQTDISQITKAISFYQEHNGNFMLPAITSLKMNKVYLITLGKSSGCSLHNRYCKNFINEDAHCVDLSALITGGYLDQLPVSPSTNIHWDQGKTDEQNGSGYTLTRKEDGSVLVESCEEN